jgi:hypothetical protein
MSCDLFENPYTDECEGPVAIDHQPEAEVRICGKHLIRNRDEWQQRAVTAEAALRDAGRLAAGVVLQ